MWPIAPMKAVSGRLPRGPSWTYEPKWDGHRALVRIRGTEIDAISSSGQHRIERWPWLRDALAAVTTGVPGETVLDGEVIALDPSGRHSFQLVGRADRPHAFVAFDVLVASDRDVMGLPWTERRALLSTLVEPTDAYLLTPVSDDADAMMTATRDGGFEGLVAKRRDSAYLPGQRSPSWVKVKHRQQQEVVVGGYLPGEGSRAASFGSLLVGVHEGGHLRYVGSVGSGLDDAALTALAALMRPLEVDSSPFEPVPRPPRGRPRWVRPVLVVEVTFAEWTLGGNLRHPVYLGLRNDVAPERVVRET